MTDRLLTDEYQEGYDARVQGALEVECPYPPATRDARDWQQGWGNADFDERVNVMEEDYGQAA